MKQWINGQEIEVSFDEQGRIEKIRQQDISKDMQIAQLLEQLVSTDYISNKIIEGDATIEQYADLIEQRKQWRAEISRLQKLSY